jgi:hypothetical protein
LLFTGDSIHIGDTAERRAKASREAQLEEARKGKKANSSVVDENIHDKERTRTAVAKEKGVSEHALKQVKKLRDAAQDVKHPEQQAKAKKVVAKLRDGEIKTLAEAVRQIDPEPSVSPCRTFAHSWL